MKLTELTPLFIDQLSSDPASLQAGKELAKSLYWESCAYSDNAVWGSCKGSGSLPYRTQIDLHQIAYKCTCPSRKFPCKHSLGLLYYYISNAAVFVIEAEPEWVKVWIDKRNQKPATEATETPVITPKITNPATLEKRHKQVIDGISELQLWLQDLVRNGLMALPPKPPSYWDDMIRRMVDAKAPGLANALKKIAEIPMGGNGWENSVWEKIVRLYAISEAYKNLTSLTEDEQYEVKSLIGFTQNQEQLKTQNGIKDIWMALSSITKEENDIMVLQTWFLGKTSGCIGLYLQFYPWQLSPALNFIVGASYQGEIVHFYGIENDRVLLKDWNNSNTIFEPETSINNIEMLHQKNIEQLQLNPFIESKPYIVAELILHKLNNNWMLIDNRQNYVLLTNKDETGLLKLFITTGGKPSKFFILGKGLSYELMGCWDNGCYYN